MNAVRHPGFHRRREQRLQDEEEQRAFQRQQRAHAQAIAAEAHRDQAAFITELVTAGRAVLARVPYH
jgi:hypothetical protein